MLAARKLRVKFIAHVGRSLQHTFVILAVFLDFSLSLVFFFFCLYFYIVLLFLSTLLMLIFIYAFIPFLSALNPFCLRTQGR